MKKVLFTMFAIVLGLGMTSCKNKDTGKDEKSEKEIAADLVALAEKAEKEGASWTVDEWKEQFREYVKTIKPMLEDKIAFKMKKKEADTNEKEKKLKEEKKELEKKYKDVIEASKKLENAARACEKGKMVFEDLDFRKEVFKDLGIEE